MNATLNIDEFRERLLFSKHQLDDELEVQARALEAVKRECAYLDRCLSDAKDDLDREEARLAAQIKRDQPELTNPMVDREVKLRDAFLVARGKYLDAKQELAEWAGLADSWEARGKALEATGRLHAQQYFALTSVRGAYRNDELIQSIRARMRIQREERRISRERNNQQSRPRRTPTHEP